MTERAPEPDPGWPHFREQFLQAIKDFSDEHEISVWRICQVGLVPTAWLEGVWRGDRELDAWIAERLAQALALLEENLDDEKKRSRRCLTWHKVRPFVDTAGQPVLAEALARRLRPIRPRRRRAFTK